MSGTDGSTDESTSTLAEERRSINTNVCTSVCALTTGDVVTSTITSMNLVPGALEDDSKATIR